MTVTKIQDEGQTLPTPRGKVLGIVDTRAAFDQVALNLKNAGFEKIEALSGEDGVNLLERINRFFFSDLEDRVLKRHIEELKAGNFILILETPAERVDEAVKIADQHGARRLVHFGLTTVTWLTK